MDNASIELAIDLGSLVARRANPNVPIGFLFYANYVTGETTVLTKGNSSLGVMGNSYLDAVLSDLVRYKVRNG